jgi:hypothetical protein
MAMFAIPLAGAAAMRSALPTWLKWTSVAGFLATLFSLAISAYPFVEVVNAPAYAAKILGTTLISNLAIAGFYLARRKSSRNLQLPAS